MLGYQSTSFHDAQFLRQTLGLRPAPEFEVWLEKMGVADSQRQIQPIEQVAQRFRLEAPAASRAVLAKSQDASLLKQWSQWTSARVALPRVGASVATSERLSFHVAHADARDAVSWPFDSSKLQSQLEESGYETLLLESNAPDRPAFLQRPDWGRQLSSRSHAQLQDWCRSHLSAEDSPFDIVLVITDGLSALGIELQARTLIEELLPTMTQRGWKVAPICIAANGRVALQDEIGALLHARLALTLIGERPGLGTPDSVGAYLVYGPQVGNTDANRNCVSNIRAGGLSPHMAAQKLLFLIEQSLALQLSGVALKDDEPKLIAD